MRGQQLMFELVQVGSNTYYIDCPAKIGVYKVSETDVYLIDSGSDKDAGRKIRKILDEKGRIKEMLTVTVDQDILNRINSNPSKEVSIKVPGDWLSTDVKFEFKQKEGLYQVIDNEIKF